MVDLSGRSKPSVRRYICWTICALLTLVPAMAGAKTVEVEVLPATLTFSYGGEQRHAVVVLRNVSAGALTAIKLSWLPDRDLSVRADATELKTLAAGSEAAWPVMVTATALESLVPAFHFQLDYVTQLPNDLRSSHVAFAMLAVKAADAGAPESLADIQVKSMLESLNAQRPGRVYLVVTNKTSWTLTVGPVTTSSPAFVTLSTGTKPQTLGPRDTLTMEFTVRAVDRVVPGKHLMVFELPLQWTAAGRPYERRLVTTKEVDVGVLGESEILKLLGVPSFLLLPGVLFLLTYRFLWASEVFGAKNEADRFSLKTEKPEFWLLSITLSGMMAFAYPKFTGHSYLESYKLEDIAWVWLVSVGLGGISWLAVVVGWRRYQAYARGRVTPTENDGAVEILWKLERQGLRLELSRASLQRGGRKLSAWLLQRPETIGDALWVGPPVVLQWLKGEDEEVAKAVDAALVRRAAGALARILKKSRTILKADWKRGEFPPRPQLVKRSDLVLEPLQDLFVEVDRTERDEPEEKERA